MVRISKKTDSMEETKEKPASKALRKTKPADMTGVTVIAVTKVSMMKPNARVKNRPVGILLKLLSRTLPGVKVNESEKMVLALFPRDTPQGDAREFRDKVLAYVTLFESFDDEGDEKALTKMMRIIEEKDCMDCVGISILTDHLARTYMEEYGYSVWTVE